MRKRGYDSMGQRFRGMVERAANVTRGLYNTIANRRRAMEDAAAAFASSGSNGH